MSSPFLGTMPLWRKLWEEWDKGSLCNNCLDSLCHIEQKKSSLELQAIQQAWLYTTERPHLLLRYHLAYAWLRQELCGITARLSRIPQGLACQHLGRAKPECSNRLERKSQGMTPLGLQDKWLEGHTKGWLPCTERYWWWFKKIKLRSLGLRTKVYIQVMRALKRLPKVCKP